MTTKTIRQVITFEASPKEIYNLLMDSKLHKSFTGSKAKISKKKSGKFEAYDGYATGANLELQKAKKIMQTWRASDWPEGHYSIATFLLDKVKKGTRLTFIQSGIPERLAKSIAAGWEQYYWQPMKAYLAGKSNT